jgi:hypothetical protein
MGGEVIAVRWKNARTPNALARKIGTVGNFSLFEQEFGRRSQLSS